MKSDSEGDASDRTIVGRPLGLNPKLFVAAPRSTKSANVPPTASPLSTPNNSAGEGKNRNSARSSYSDTSDTSDGGTIFSDSCPSLADSGASDPTTFATDSARSSFSSTKSGRNRYPALLIPRDSWGSITLSPIKEIAIGMSPATKIRLTPSILSSLGRSAPALNAPPSLGDGSSVASDSPCVPALSAPSTPDMRHLEIAEGEEWGSNDPGPPDQALEIALDEEHSIVLSPAEAYSSIVASRDWSDIVMGFPRIPGATPQENSPVMPQVHGRIDFPTSVPSEHGVELPAMALRTLASLTRQRSLAERSDSSIPSWTREEMQERPTAPSRPRSADGVTPLSNYSFSELSIPSPGGFFSSLQAGTRSTWCVSGTTKSMDPPSSTTAENFYNLPWNKPDQVVETILEVADTNLTEGPPTARQAPFEPSHATRQRSNSSTSYEDHDLYAPASPPLPKAEAEIRHEYEEAYDEEIKQAAEANLDRTSTWLSAQNTYLSALRETNPLNDPADYPAAPSLQDVSPTDSKRNSVDSPTRRAVRFLEAASKTTAEVAVVDSAVASPATEEKEPVFLNAFQHHVRTRKRRDAFLFASSRLDAIEFDRIAMQDRHISRLQGQLAIVTPKRPKYSGPFSQNPRATGIFERTPEQILYSTAEREKAALDSIMPSTWQVEALRTMLDGRLLAAPAACDRLTTKSKVALTDPSVTGNKRPRVLDLGGTSCASWAWHAAQQWSNVKVYTVNTKAQAAAEVVEWQPKAAGPPNHRSISVPHLWQLPFRCNYFDVISARSLHELLKSNPIPGVPQIDEWDMTLRECMRVLKPGGYLDYMVMDSSIAHAGPRGEAMAVEFGFELHRRGYEREATKVMLRKLKKEGFVGMKRAWMYLPMGKKTEHAEPPGKASGYTGNAFAEGKTRPAPRPLSEVSSVSHIVNQYLNVEAVQGPVGNTAGISDVTGLLGAWMWEEWLVKVRSEMGREKSRWLEGVSSVIEEGKENGSGWKVLVGWARKPRVGKVEKKDGGKSAGQGKGTEIGEIPMIIQE